MVSTSCSFNNNFLLFRNSKDDFEVKVLCILLLSDFNIPKEICIKIIKFLRLHLELLFSGGGGLFWKRRLKSLKKLPLFPLLYMEHYNQYWCTAVKVNMYSFKDTDECSSKISITQNDERMALAPTFYTLIHKTVYHDLIFYSNTLLCDCFNSDTKKIFEGSYING